MGEEMNIEQELRKDRDKLLIDNRKLVEKQKNAVKDLERIANMPHNLMLHIERENLKITKGHLTLIYRELLKVTKDLK